MVGSGAYLPNSPPQSALKSQSPSTIPSRVELERKPPAIPATNDAYFISASKNVEWIVSKSISSGQRKYSNDLASLKASNEAECDSWNSAEAIAGGKKASESYASKEYNPEHKGHTERTTVLDIIRGLAGTRTTFHISVMNGFVPLQNAHQIEHQ